MSSADSLPGKRSQIVKWSEVHEVLGLEIRSAIAFSNKTYGFDLFLSREKVAIVPEHIVRNAWPQLPPCILSAEESMLS
jgi:hypothetical protein